MATYKPVVIKNGELQQLQTGDDLQIPGRYISNIVNSPGFEHSNAGPAWLLLKDTSAGGKAWRVQSTNLNLGWLGFYNETDGVQGPLVSPTGGLVLGGGATDPGAGNLLLVAPNDTSLRLDTSSTVPAARNWSLAANYAAWGDFQIKQSNAIGGDPNTGTVRFYLGVSGGANIGGVVDSGAGNLYLGAGSNLQLVRVIAAITSVLELYSTNANAAARNWAILNGNIVHGDFSIVQSAAIGGDPLSGGNLRLYIDAAGKFSIPSGYAPDSGGLKHQRVSAGAIANNSTALVDVTWPTAFADANYTAVCSLFLASGYGPPALQIAAITVKTAAKVQVAIINQTGGTLTPDLFVVAIHD